MTTLKAYDVLFSIEKMKHLVGSDVQHEGHVVHSGHERGSSKSNFSNEICNYCKRKRHIKKDCYKLQNK